jgi:hypothetical protein
MVETNPSDEELDEYDPYSTALKSDDEAAQLRTVSLEDEPGRDHRPTPGSENAPTRRSHEDVPRRNAQ